VLHLEPMLLALADRRSLFDFEGHSNYLAVLLLAAKRGAAMAKADSTAAMVQGALSSCCASPSP
jgi:hypothetical protein